MDWINYFNTIVIIIINVIIIYLNLKLLSVCGYFYLSFLLSLLRDNTITHGGTVMLLK